MPGSFLYLTAHAPKSETSSFLTAAFSPYCYNQSAHKHLESRGFIHTGEVSISSNLSLIFSFARNCPMPCPSVITPTPSHLVLWLTVELLIRVFHEQFQDLGIIAARWIRLIQIQKSSLPYLQDSQLLLSATVLELLSNGFDRFSRPVLLHLNRLGQLLQQIPVYFLEIGESLWKRSLACGIEKRHLQQAMLTNVQRDGRLLYVFGEESHRFVSIYRCKKEKGKRKSKREKER